MQNQLFFQSDNAAANIVQPSKPAKKRGRKPLPFVAKPTPSALVLEVLQVHACLNFDQLLKQTKLSEDKLCQALSNLIINTRQVYSFSRQEVRYYRCGQNF